MSELDYSRYMVKIGAQKLAENGFKKLEGLRVGLITNHTALVGKLHLIELLATDPKVGLVCNGSRSMHRSFRTLPSLR